MLPFAILLIFLFHSLPVLGEVPPDWLPKVQAGQMLYSPVEPANKEWMPVIGNGYIAMVVTQSSLHIGGVFNGYNNTEEGQGQNSHRADIPCLLSVDIDAVDATPYGSALDMQNAIFYRRSRGINDARLLIEQRWYAHRAYPNLLVHEISIDCRDCTKDSQIRLITPNTSSSDIAFKNVQSPDGTSAIEGSTLIREVPTSPLTTVVSLTTNIPSTLSISKSQVQTLTFFQILTSSLDSSNPLFDAVQYYDRFSKINNLELFNSHSVAWGTIWESGIEISGNLTIAAAVNSSLYSILSSLRDDWDYSISPGGIANNAYRGHTFWDGETWMYPTLLALHPNIAASMLRYREKRLPEAMDKARWSGYKGASWPWESAFTGYECTCCYPYNNEGQLEIHITGDIALAFIQYYYATGDKQWLRTSGWPVIYQIAEFWKSRVIYQNQKYNILDVQCPDESSAHVNNSVYTNVVASMSLSAATYVSRLLNEPVDPSWEQIANNLAIPFDQQLQIHLQYDGYNGHLINQADVVLLQYPLRYPMTPKVALNDILYYQNKTRNNGMFTGDATYSIANIRLGNLKEAQVFWDLSFPHIKAPFNCWTERITGGANHFITGAGGFLQNILFGFGGYDLNLDSVTFNPVFLQNSGVTFFKFRKMNYLGSTYSLSFTSKSITVERLSGPLLYVTDSTGRKQALQNSIVLDLQKIQITQ
eukprot:TRINITY_DN1261_c0_g1_i2.p1 TRINITY_DN1261_c0_g1~~TRINITY_DN1261_c0_g1_i2.p1  ORF type:complete len:703 (-),score=111.97 TRINITY_DN1261_c0_g1_i2:9-2117(-)